MNATILEPLTQAQQRANELLAMATRIQQTSLDITALGLCIELLRCYQALQLLGRRVEWRASLEEKAS